MSAAVQQAVIAQQLPEQEKQCRAQHSIDNSGPWARTETDLHALWQRLQQQASEQDTGPQRAWPHHWPECPEQATGRFVPHE